MPRIVDTVSLGVFAFGDPERSQWSVWSALNTRSSRQLCASDAGAGMLGEATWMVNESTCSRFAIETVPEASQWLFARH